MYLQIVGIFQYLTTDIKLQITALRFVLFMKR